MRNGSADLIGSIRRAVLDSENPLWVPDLSQALAERGWKLLNQRFGITRANYGTNRMLFRSSSAPRRVVMTVHEGNDTGASAGEILVEELPADAWRRIAKDAEANRIDEDSAGPQILDEAFSAIKEVTTIYGTIFVLIRALHLLRSDDLGEYDISFSEPHLPFSIFVSVPNRRYPADFLRVAEGIVHEAMHLQLTLIEGVALLFRAESAEFYSPWRDEYRPVYGVLHGLYVFGVLREFYGRLLGLGRLANQQEFLTERYETIGSQLADVIGLESNPALTEFGQALVKRIRTLQENYQGNPSPSS